NIVWSATMKNAFLSSDTALAEFLMSLSGTYIYDAQGRPTYYASLLADNNNLVQALLEGGEIDYYRCDNTDAKQCLNLTKSKINFPQNKGLQNRIRTTLEELYQALVNDNGLSNAQKSFLEYTETPILAIFSSAAKANRLPNFAAYSRMISIELLNRYLVGMLNVVQTSISNTQIDQKDIALITTDIDRAKKSTDGLAAKAIRLVLEQEELIQAHKSNDKDFMNTFSEKLQQNLNFGDGA
ncbi:conjugal transfer protein TraH, partial [Vibrio parahaemolyticus]|nr:conjugal transfer protein TraH [Vibrio parahaemolyticus]